MLALTLIVASIALADSVNPSTLVPALWLASARAGRGLVSFTLGVFVVYVVGGLVLVLGPGPALIHGLHHLRGPLEHAVEAAVGMLALALSVATWRSARASRSESDHPRPPRCNTRPAAFALGAGIMAIELPTAFMYFGAISAILAAKVQAPAEVGLVLAYNALFVGPLLALVVLRRLAGERVDRWVLSAAAWLQRAGALALSGAAGAVGAAFLVIGVGGLIAA